MSYEHKENAKDRERNGKSVTPAQPCRICGKTTWCMAYDGGGAYCNRKDTDPDGKPGKQKPGKQGWYYPPLRDQPCRICGGWDQCLDFTDGGANCYGKDTDPDGKPGKPKTDRNGDHYWSYPSPKGFTPPPTAKEKPRPAQAESPKPKPADHDKLDRVYLELQQQLTLNDRHTKLLLGRGLSPQVIQQSGFRSIPEHRPTLNAIAASLADRFSCFDQVPGCCRDPKTGKPTLAFWDWKGVLIFCRGLQGLIQSVQVRLDNPKDPNDRYRWFSSNSNKHKGPKANSGPSWWGPCPAQAEVVRITEGAFKALMAWEVTGIPGIAAGAGVASMAAPELLQWLEALRPREVLFCPDQDVYFKDHVARATAVNLNTLIDLAARQGFTLKVERWNMQDEPQDRPKGIDDALQAGLTIHQQAAGEFLAMLPSIPLSDSPRLQDLPTDEVPDSEKSEPSPLSGLLQAVRAMGKTCDGASERDRVGFNAKDTGFFAAHLQAAEKGTEFAPALRKRILDRLAKYSNQLLDLGFNIHEIAAEESRRNQEGESPEKPPSDPTPKGKKVILSGVTSQKVEQTLSALHKVNNPPTVFIDQSTGTISELRSDGEFFQCYTTENLANVLERGLGLEFYAYNKEGEEYRTDPPDKTLKRISGLHPIDTGIPVLTEVVGVPVMASDGTLITKPGLHHTGIYLKSGLELPPIPESPSPELVSECVAAINLLLADFPFEGRPDWQVCWSYILSGFLANKVPRPWPMWNFSAPCQGSGKGLLASLPSVIASGCSGGVISIDPSEKEPEIRKKLTSILASKPARWQILDNVKGYLNSSSLEAFLTTSVWSDRILGGNKMGNWPNNIALALTGNNLTLSRDLERRQVMIRLIPDSPQPWLRNDFEIPDLTSYILANRARIVWQILVIIQRWISLGFPQGSHRLGSFEGWSAALGGLLDCVGIGSDFLASTRVVHREDPWQVFMQKWADSYLDRARQPASELVRFVEEAGISVTESSPARSLGKQLAKQVGRTFAVGDEAKAFVRLRSEVRCNQILWSLEPVAPRRREDHQNKTSKTSKPPNPLSELDPGAAQTPTKPLIETPTLPSDEGLPPDAKAALAALDIH